MPGTISHSKRPFMGSVEVAGHGNTHVHLTIHEKLFICLSDVGSHYRGDICLLYF